jgi:hypothetical protein
MIELNPGMNVERSERGGIEREEKGMSWIGLD